MVTVGIVLVYAKANVPPKNFNDYAKRFPKEVRQRLEAVRETIREAAPARLTSDSILALRASRPSRRNCRATNLLKAPCSSHLTSLCRCR
jgi:hypothetical protein